MDQVAQTTLSDSLEPICPRDDHRMHYEAKGVSWKTTAEAKHTETLPSYHCNFEGCSVRYDPVNGYYTVVFTPDQPFFIEEPGANILQCPRHGSWLYRAESRDGDSRFRWRCGVEGCNYSRPDESRS